MRNLNIGITMGDPAGIGPEIVTKMLHDIAKSGIHKSCTFIVIGDCNVIEQNLKRIESDLKVNAIRDVDDALPTTINVYAKEDLDVSDVTLGQMCSLSGEASMKYNREGAELAMRGDIDALLTSPVTKASAKLAGYDFVGQAEYFAHLAGQDDFKTILIYKDFKAALFTTHCPLIEACKYVKKENIVDAVRYLHKKRFDFGAPNIRIAVAALNPHAGESGTMGREEIEELEPAVAQLKAEGINVDGPYPVNAIISPPYDGRDYDITLALFHDQVVARMNMHETTTLTFGLPFIRTSVGHGSALDIAGKGIATTSAVVVALEHTIELAFNRVKASEVLETV
ncbi:PdxA family dehydrogenase [Vibrio mediterranei]|uniref:PdxA family dehydrogenase n=1 Tax=Vibrio mediterranei TaxID=689 RepID=UPI00148D9CC2|nr:4-hydroxythreonine-4-phosphate dehydrogenase PdxA [Vibrio mediterranei]NOI23809.1 hypothetical protein [Vibrio mediterranei]